MVTKGKKRIKKTTSKCSNCKHVKLLSKAGKEFMISCIEHIAKRLLLQEMAVVRLYVVRGSEIFPSMSMNMMNYAVKKLSTEKNVKSKFFNSIVTVDNEAVLSSLSGDSSTTNISSSSPTETSNEATTALLMLKNISNTTASFDDTVPCPKTVAVPSIQEFIDTNLNVTNLTKNIGRPKGIIVAASIYLTQ
jgi:hypothetical protein